MSHAFIFDMDGVIIDSNPTHNIALRQFCLKYGYDLTEQQLMEKIFGRANKDWIANLFNDVTSEQVKQLGEEKEAMFRDLFEDVIKPLDGLLDFLHALEEKEIPRAIATSAPQSNVDFVLKKTGIGPYFTTILNESHINHGKPDPEIYLKTVQALKLPAGQCVVFEDSLSGILAAKSAGCKVVGVTTTHTPDQMPQVDTTIDHFSDLDPDILLSRLF